jgi:sulfur carrier protein ThiS
MKLYLGGFYRHYRPQDGNWLEVSLPAPQPLRDVLTGLGIPPGEIALVVINHTAVELDAAIVSDEDEVRLYPPVGGG